MINLPGCIHCTLSVCSFALISATYIRPLFLGGDCKTSFWVYRRLVNQSCLFLKGSIFPKWPNKSKVILTLILHISDDPSNLHCFMLISSIATGLSRRPKRVDFFDFAKPGIDLSFTATVQAVVTQWFQSTFIFTPNPWGK